MKTTLHSLPVAAAVAADGRRIVPVRPSPPRYLGGYNSQKGYLMVECLVYIGVLFLILGAGYVALYQGIDNSVTLHRNADDISTALRAGERWRTDVRSATAIIQVEPNPEGASLRIPIAGGDVSYRFATNAILRRYKAGPWISVVSNVKSFNMESDPRERVTAWRWDLELEPRRKASITRMRPLFTFTAVPGKPSIK